MSEKIKVSAPRSNPHICYIPKEYKEQIEELKKRTNLSLYQLLCTCSKCELDTAEHIKAFKSELKSKGFRNIGEWAIALIEMLYAIKEDLGHIDLASVNVKQRAE